MALFSRRVQGRFIAGVMDGPDPDEEPDIIPMRGTVTFTPSIPYWPILNDGEDPTIFVPATFVGVIDEQGYLCTPDPIYPTQPGYRGIRLFTNDAPHALVKNWTWQVTYRLDVVNGTTPSIKSHAISLVSSPLDYWLARTVDVPSSPGVGEAQAFSLVDRAEGAAVASAGSAANAALVAQSVRDDADAGEFNGAPGAPGAPGPAGPNTVPTDAAIAGAITTPASATSTALSAAYVQRVAKKQSYLYGAFLQKIKTEGPVKIIARGDSLTYGQDTVSADKIAAPSGTLPDGSTHAQTRAPITYPSAMEGYLNEALGAGRVSVINQGYSGDWAKRSYERWSANVSADLTIINLGVNDSRAVWAEFPGQISPYVEWIEKHVIREVIARNTACVIMLPTKQRGADADGNLVAFRASLYAMAESYGVPIIDAEPMLGGYSTSVFSDDTHLNSTGYQILGARMAATIMGAGPHAPFHVASGTRLSTRPTLDNMVIGPGATRAATSGATLPEGQTASGIRIDLGYVYYTFHTTEADLLAIPTYYINGGGAVDVALDFGVIQPGNVLDQIVDEVSMNAVAPSSFSVTIASGVATNSLTAATASAGVRFLRIASPGWHTLRIRKTAGAPNAVSMMALEFMDFRTYNASRSTLATGEAVGSYYTPVPPAYDTSQPILTTRAPLAGVLAKTGVKDWGTLYGQAPAFKIAIHSYGEAVIEYLMVVKSSPTLGTGGITFSGQLRRTDLRVAPDESFVREIESVTWDDATKEIVFTWKSTGKSTIRNFSMTISLL